MVCIGQQSTKVSGGFGVGSPGFAGCIQEQAVGRAGEVGEGAQEGANLGRLLFEILGDVEELFAIGHATEFGPGVLSHAFVHFKSSFS